MLSYSEARETVLREVAKLQFKPGSEEVSLPDSLSRVLSSDIPADRDYPPFNRSTRDGFAVRAIDVEDLPATLKLVGEVRAGQSFAGVVGGGECVQIMTGAPVPAGADAVVMVEYTETSGDKVTVNRGIKTGGNIVPQGSEAKEGDVILRGGTRLGYVQIGALGQTGKAKVPVYRKPRVAVLSTGDEIVHVQETPGPNQIRNSNSFSLGAQVTLAGGEPVLLGNARDERAALEEYLRRGLEEDLLVITGGVSMGKYDLVEEALKKLGAEFYFDSVAIRPGRPAVLGRCGEKPVFGLPGNPLSTMVTFELFVAPAIAVMAGAPASPLRYHMAQLAETFTQKPNLTLFVPATLEREDAIIRVRPLPWKGSGDVAGLAGSDCFLIVPEGDKDLEAGEWAQVLMRLGAGEQ
jgi:molybdopterin molybdotransferase